MNNISIDQNAVEALRNFTNPSDIQFGKTLVPGMLKSTYSDGQWSPLELMPYQKILLDPAAKVLHYAQEIFEGLKSYKNEKGEVFLFRPDKNARRFNFSARRMGMPEFPEEMFINSLEALVRYSHHTFTTDINDSFYLRPFMFGDEPQLGVKPSSTYQYILIGGPAGSYFSRPSVRVRVEKESHRASSKGIGCAKTGGNYAASMEASIVTKEAGFDQTLWLDPAESKYIEELSGMNFFAVINGVLTTPKLGNSILHGVTRESLLTIANHMGVETQERHISITELMEQLDRGECTEMFACGTASVLTPIECLMLDEKISTAKHPEGDLSKKLKKFLQELQTGRSEDQFDWRIKVNID